MKLYSTTLGGSSSYKWSLIKLTIIIIIIITCHVVAVVAVVVKFVNGYCNFVIVVVY